MDCKKYQIGYNVYEGELMKRIFVLLLFMLLCLPVFAWNEKATDISLEYLNKSVHSKVHNFMKSIYSDEARIDKIKASYKANPNSIKNKEVNEFTLACIQRNQNLLNTYHNEYFIPAYNEYKKYDSSETLQDWIYSVGLSEISEFYEFYRATELNLEDCQKFYELSK